MNQLERQRYALFYTLVSPFSKVWLMFPKMPLRW
jgi:hypothetical protein